MGVWYDGKVMDFGDYMAMLAKEKPKAENTTTVTSKDVIVGVDDPFKTKEKEVKDGSGEQPAKPKRTRKSSTK